MLCSTVDTGQICTMTFAHHLCLALVDSVSRRCLEQIATAAKLAPSRTTVLTLCNHKKVLVSIGFTHTHTHLCYFSCNKPRSSENKSYSRLQTVKREESDVRANSKTHKDMGSCISTTHAPTPTYTSTNTLTDWFLLVSCLCWYCYSRRKHKVVVEIKPTSISQESLQTSQ